MKKFSVLLICFVLTLFFSSLAMATVTVSGDTIFTLNKSDSGATADASFNAKLNDSVSAKVSITANTWLMTDTTPNDKTDNCIAPTLTVSECSATINPGFGSLLLGYFGYSISNLNLLGSDTVEMKNYFGLKYGMEIVKGLTTSIYLGGFQVPVAGSIGYESSIGGAGISYYSNHLSATAFLQPINLFKAYTYFDYSDLVKDKNTPFKDLIVGGVITIGKTGLSLYGEYNFIPANDGSNPFGAKINFDAPNKISYAYTNINNANSVTITIYF